MKFDSLGIAALRVALSRKFIVKFLGASRPFRYLEQDFLSSSQQAFDVDLIQNIDDGKDWFPEVDQYISAPKYFRKRAVYKLQDAAVDTATGYIYDSKKRLVGDVLSWSVPAAVADRPAMASKFKKIDSTRDSLFLGNQGFYHWLIEELPAYLIARSAAPNAITYIQRRSPPYLHDVLKLLNADFEVLPVAASIPSLLLASKGVALVPNRVDLNILNKFGNSIDTFDGGPEKIYISRRDSGRMPDNESEIEQTLIEHGFKIIQLSGLSLLEQITLFKNAKVIVGTHGAGLANLAWCDPLKTKIVEIKLKSNPKCFEWLAHVAEMKYSKVESEFTTEWVVNISELTKTVEIFQD